VRMKLPRSEIVVMDLAGNCARIYCDDAKSIERLAALGFHWEEGLFVKNIAEESERQYIANELVKSRAVFSAGRDWSPAELIAYYREQGIVREKYRVIAWTKKDVFEIRNC